MTLHRRLLIVGALAVGGCTSIFGTNEPARLGEPFWVPVAGSRAVPEAELSLRFVEVLEDSRCPSGPLIECVWAGRVRIRLGITSYVDGEAVHELRLLDDPSDLIVGDFRIELLAITPLRTLDPIEPGRYRAQFVVAANAEPAAP